MNLYGTIYIAMHGPAKLLRQAAELPEMERFEDAETAQTVRENLTKAGKSAAGEGIAVAYWKDFKDSNQNLETYMKRPGSGFRFPWRYKWIKGRTGRCALLLLSLFSV